MSHYRLSFLEALAAPPRGVDFAPRHTIWHGTEADMLAARKDRCKRLYQVLLTEVGEKASRNADVADHLWVRAQVMVSEGMDLQ